MATAADPLTSPTVTNPSMTTFNTLASLSGEGDARDAGESIVATLGSRLVSSSSDGATASVTAVSPSGLDVAIEKKPLPLPLAEDRDIGPPPPADSRPLKLRALSRKDDILLVARGVAEPPGVVGEFEDHAGASTPRLEGAGSVLILSPIFLLDSERFALCVYSARGVGDATGQSVGLGHDIPIDRTANRNNGTAKAIPYEECEQF